MIVTLKEQLDDPHTLEAVHVTAVVPVEKVDPEAGVQLTVADGVAVEVGFVQVATWLLHCVIFEGQAPITGVVFMVTLKEHDEVPQIFVAAQTTLVVPVANVDPEAGVQETVGLGTPVAVGFVQVAT